MMGRHHTAPTRTTAISRPRGVEGDRSARPMSTNQPSTMSTRPTMNVLMDETDEPGWGMNGHGQAPGGFGQVPDRGGGHDEQRAHEAERWRPARTGRSGPTNAARPPTSGSGARPAVGPRRPRPGHRAEQVAPGRLTQAGERLAASGSDRAGHGRWRQRGGAPGATGAVASGPVTPVGCVPTAHSSCSSAARRCRSGSRLTDHGRARSPRIERPKLCPLSDRSHRPVSRGGFPVTGSGGQKYHGEWWKDQRE